MINFGETLISGVTLGQGYEIQFTLNTDSIPKIHEYDDIQNSKAFKAHIKQNPKYLTDS